MALGQKSQIQLIGFDLDGTLVDGCVFFWSTLHEYFRSDPARRKKASDDFHAGRISYRQWFECDLKMLKERGANRTSIVEAIAGLRLTPGADETLQVLRQRGYKLAVISGSLDILLHHFFPTHPFHHVLINQIEFDPAGKISGGTPTPYDLEGKAQGLEELARLEGISLNECAFIGDNMNDLAVMRAAGFSIGFQIKNPKVAQVVDVVVDEADLRAVLPCFPGKAAGC